MKMSKSLNEEWDACRATAFATDEYKAWKKTIKANVKAYDSYIATDEYKAWDKARDACREEEKKMENENA